MQRTIRYSSLLLLLSGLILSCEREISPEQADRFIKFYGNYFMDQQGDMEVLSNGGYAICGTETSELLGKRMVLIITDEYGNVQSGYPKYYNEEGLETGGSSLIALQGGTGGFLISGFIEKPVQGTQAVQKDIFLVRTNASGAVTWKKSYGSDKDEYILHAIQKNNSGYLLAGYQVKNGYSDLMVMGVSEEGDSLRLGLNYSNPNAQNSAATFLLNTGGMYLCACTYDKINNRGTGIRILTFDDELSPLVRNLSGEADEYGMCILEERPGSFLVLGNRENGSGNMELVLYGIETDGLLVTKSSELATKADQNTDLIGKKIVRTAAGKLVIVGTRKEGTESELMLQFVSALHQVEEQRTYGASGAQTGMDIELSRDGGFVLLGANSEGESSTVSLMKTSSTGDL